MKKIYEETIDLTVTDLLALSGQRRDRLMLCAEEEAVPLSETEEETLPGNEVGTIFHKLMEILVSKKPHRIAASFFRLPLTRFLSADERKEMERSIVDFWNGAWGGRIRKAERCYPELPFIYKTKQGLLKGQIDLVFQTAGGEWIILDYKTNRIESSQKTELAQAYELQLAIYALVFKKITGVTPAKGVLYFSRIRESAEFFYDDKILAATDLKILDFYRGLRENEPAQ